MDESQINPRLLNIFSILQSVSFYLTFRNKVIRCKDLYKPLSTKVHYGNQNKYNIKNYFLNHATTCTSKFFPSQLPVSVHKKVNTKVAPAFLLDKGRST